MFFPNSILISSFFFFSSRRRHTRYWRDWSSDVCSSDLFNTFVSVGSLFALERTSDPPTMSTQQVCSLGSSTASLDRLLEEPEACHWPDAAPRRSSHEDSCGVCPDFRSTQ